MMKFEQVTGKDAFIAHLATLKPKNGSKEIWFKFGHGQFIVGNWDESGDFSGWSTKLADKEDPTSRVKTFQVKDVFTYLSKKCSEIEGGAFYIPTQPIGAPLKDCVDSTDDIGIEMDQGEPDEQLQLYRDFYRVSGMLPASLLKSGGKSIHGHFKVDEHIPVEQAQYLRRLFCLAFASDPVTVRLHQPMRFAGFFRKEKGQDQALIYSDPEASYSYEMMLVSLKNYFEFLGWTFPASFTDEWWTAKFHTALKNSNQISREERFELVREALEQGLEGWEAERSAKKVATEKRRAELMQQMSERQVKGGFDAGSLIELVNTANQNAGPDWFNFAAHDWKWQGGKARGIPHCHTSNSKNSAWISSSGSGWTYHCTACTNDNPVDAFRYWLSTRKNFGINDRMPSGKQWVELALEFLSYAGVTVPDSLKKSAAALDPSEEAAIAKLLKEIEDLEAAEDYLADEANEKAEAARKARYEAELAKKHEYFNSLDLVPTIEETGEYMSPGRLQLDPAKPGLYVIDGTMGSGKTKSTLEPIVKRHRAQYPKAARLLGFPTNNLGVQTCYEFGVKHRTDKQFLTNNSTEIGFCLESIHHLITPEMINAENGPPLWILDEASQTFSQILSGQTTGESFAAVVSRIRAIAQKIVECGGWIILSEDGVTNLEVDFLKDACGIEVREFYKFTKQFQMQRTYTVVDERTAVIERIEELLRDGERVVFASDSESFLKDVQARVDALEIGVNAVYLTGANSDEDWVKALLRDPIDYLRSRDCQFFGYTPALASGGSINDKNGFFDEVVFYISHLEPTKAKQLLERLRSDVPRYGYVAERGLRLDRDPYANADPAIINQSLRRNWGGMLKILGFAQLQESSDIDILEQAKVIGRMAEEWDNPTTDFGFYIKYYCAYRSKEIYAKKELRSRLIDYWLSAGHDVIEEPVMPNAGIKSELKAMREDREAAYNQAFANCNPRIGMTIQDARAILDDPKADDEAKMEAQKFILMDKLPGCPLDDPEFVTRLLDDNRKLLTTTELLWLMHFPEGAKEMDQRTYRSSLAKAAKEDRFVRVDKMPTRAAKAKLLASAPLHPFITGEIEEYGNDDKEVEAVKQWALFRKPQLKRYLALNVNEKQSAVTIANKVLDRVGYKAVRLRRVGEAKVSVYGIVNLESKDREMIFESLNTRYQMSQNSSEFSLVDEDLENVSTGNDREVELPKLPEVVGNVVQLPPTPSVANIKPKKDSTQKEFNVGERVLVTTEKCWKRADREKASAELGSRLGKQGLISKAFVGTEKGRKCWMYEIEFDSIYLHTSQPYSARYLKPINEAEIS